MSDVNAGRSTTRNNSNLALKRKSEASREQLIAKKSPLKSSIILNQNEQSDKANGLLSDLPNEILLKIFDMLSFDDLFNLDCVNQRLRAVNKKLVWSKIQTLDHEFLIKNTYYPKISFAQAREEEYHRLIHRYYDIPNRQKINNKWVKQFLSRTNTKILDLSIYFPYLSHILCSSFVFAPQLIKLNLSLISLENSSLNTISQCCPLLEEIKLEKCFFNKYVESGLHTLFTKCKNIQYIDIAKNSKINGQSFKYIPIQIRYLNVSNCYDLTSNEMNLLSYRAAKNLETLILGFFNVKDNLNIWLKNFTNLKYLEIPYMNIHVDNHPPLDFTELIELEMLCLNNNSLTKRETLTSLQQYCHKLKALDLSRIDFFNINIFEILKKCKSLKYCKIGDINIVDGIIEFVEICKLEYLAIGYCEGLSENILKVLMTECESLDHFEIFGEEYHEVLSSILSNNHPKKQRNNVLKLAVLEGMEAHPFCEWCEIYICINYVSPFSYFTDIRSQY